VQEDEKYEQGKGSNSKVKPTSNKPKKRHVNDVKGIRLEGAARLPRLVTGYC
jgi:hypothetical protein